MIVSLFLTIPISCFAANYYVSKTGNDASNGSITNPFRTIQKSANLLKPGDTLFVREGVYNEKVIVNVSGSELGGFITIAGYPGETAIIDGANITSSRHMLLIENKSYLRISNLTFRNNIGTSVDGITVRGNSHHIELLSNKIHDIKVLDPLTQNGHAIHIIGNDSNMMHNIIVDGNEVSCIEPGRSEALTINGYVDGFRVSNNKVYDIGNIGIDIAGHFGANSDPSKDQARNGVVSGNEIYNCNSHYGGGHAAGLYVDGAKNIILERNIVHHTQRGIEIGCENYGTTAEGIIVRNNLVYSNLKSGIGIGGYNPTLAGKVINSTITNNIFFKNDTSNAGYGELILCASDNVTVKNNIFYAFSNVLISSGGVDTSYVTNYKSDYNIWYSEVDPSTVKFKYIVSNYGFNNYKSVSGQDQHSKFTNPLFSSPATNDFHLSSLSPAVDAGDPSFVFGTNELDLDMKYRVVNARVDIGAFEKQSATIVSPYPIISNIQVSNITTTSAKISWQTDQNTTGSVRFGTTTTYGSEAADINNALTHSITLKSLMPATTYHFKVKAVNINGTVESQDFSFITQAAAITVDGKSSEWANVVTLVKAANLYPKQIKIASDSTKLYLLAMGTMLNTRSQFFIDTDNNRLTGFKDSYWSASGFEYLIEDGYIYKYTGSGTSWSWSKVGTVNIVKNSTVVEVGVEMTKLGISSGKTIHLGYVRGSSSTQRLPVKGSVLPQFILK